MDILLEAKRKFYRQPVMHWLTNVPHRHTKAVVKGANRQLARVGTGLSAVGSRLSVIMIPHAKSSDTASHGGTDQCGGSEAHARHTSREAKEYGDLRNNMSSPTPMSPITERPPSSAPLSPISPLPSSKSVTSFTTAHTDTNASAESASAATGSVTLGGGAGKRRFASAVRTVITANRAMNNSPVTSTGTSQVAPQIQRTKILETGDEGAPEGERGRNRPASSTLRVSRMATLVPALKSLQPSQFFQPHTALVRHLQFSPNGEFLATCRYANATIIRVAELITYRSWDRTCLIFSIKVWTCSASRYNKIAHKRNLRTSLSHIVF